MPETQQKYVSMEPEDFVVGGLLNDADVRAAEFRACLYDYDGKSPEPAVCIKGTLYQLDKDGNVIQGMRPVVQYWSFGNHSDYAPSEDGRGIIPIGTAEAGRQNSNWHIFLKSLRDCGMPKGMLGGGDLGALDGLDFHCMQVPAPKRAGLEQREGERERTVMIAQKVLRWPGQPGKPKPSSKPRANAVTVAPSASPAPSATPAPAAAADGEDPSVMAANLLDQILAQNNGIVEKNALKMSVFRALGTSKASLRNAVVALVSDDAFLASQGCEVQPDAVMRS